MNRDIGDELDFSVTVQTETLRHLTAEDGYLPLKSAGMCWSTWPLMATLELCEISKTKINP